MQLSLDLTLSFSRHSSMCVYVKVVCVLVLQKPLHQTVSEILSTAKGTTFFVLTEAGEHGPGPAGMEKVGRSVETAGNGSSCQQRQDGA